MTELEKCELAIQKGYTYNPETGDIISGSNNLIKAKVNGYITLGLWYKTKNYMLKGHRFGYYCIYNELPEFIDHIDRNPLNNKIINLRKVTKQENNFNSKAKGYTLDKRRNKYKAEITVNRKSIFLGEYNTPEEAREAYLKAKEIYHIINN